MDSIITVAKRFTSGQLSVTAFAQRLIARLATFNRTYRAFSHLARNIESQAEILHSELEAAGTRSGLHGLGISLKGNIPVAGLPWTEGSPIYANRIAATDAGIVAQARRAGGVILGTTTLPELAIHATANRFEPLGVNPWDKRRSAGTSSTGAGVAAALALAHVNIGTDSGGSIRNPACYCGTVGFMPSIGKLSLDGIPNYAPTFSTVGLITRNVGDAKTAFQVLAELPPQRQQPTGRLLVVRDLIEKMCDDETLQLFTEALDHLRRDGITLIETTLPGWLEAERAAAQISLFEYGQILIRMRLERAGEDIRAKATAAAAITAMEADAARIVCAQVKRAFLDALERAGADAIVTPTSPFPAPTQQSAI